MKNSNSRDKNTKTQVPPSSGSNRLLKTDVHQPRQEQMGGTNYNRPASGKKIQSNKNIPPKGPIQKKQYVVADNMTESRIHEAKQGLQLLKKKMSSKGLSRQKTSSNQQIPEKPAPSLKSLGSNKTQQTQYYQNRNTNMPPKKTEKKNSYQQNSQKPPTSKLNSTKSINDSKPTPQNQRKKPPQPQYDQYQDEQMQAPIKPKKDFNALLEQQLRKQKQNGGGSKPVYSQKMPSYSQQQNIQLIQCSYCQRKFGEAAIQKHQKICLKVFQTKRKAFDSAAHRAPQVEGFQQPKVTQNKKNEPPKAQKKTVVQPKKQEEQIPKWKAASLAFRANLKQAKGATLTEQQKKANDIAQGMVQCNYCGRKFNQKAASRHIPFCQTKSKQLPRGNTKKK